MSGSVVSDSMEGFRLAEGLHFSQHACLSDSSPAPQLLVRDPTGQPLARVPVNIVDQCIVRGSAHSCACSGSVESQSDGFVERICNIPLHTTMAVFKVSRDSLD